MSSPASARLYPSVLCETYFPTSIQALTTTSDVIINAGSRNVASKTLTISPLIWKEVMCYAETLSSFASHVLATVVFVSLSSSRALTSDWLWSLHTRKNSRAAAKTSEERSNGSERIKNKQLLSVSFVFTNTWRDTDRWSDTPTRIHIFKW